MARNERSPEKITIRKFTPEEAAEVTRAYKSSDLKKPEFWTQVIVAGCQQMKKEVAR